MEAEVELYNWGGGGLKMPNPQPAMDIIVKFTISH